MVHLSAAGSAKYVVTMTNTNGQHAGVFIDSVTAGVAPSPSIFDGRAALILADAATRSARTGERVAVAAVPEPVAATAR